MRPPFVILDFPAAPARPGGGTLLFENPVAVLEARTIAEVEPVMRMVEQHTARGCHAVGWIAYEAAPAFDSAMAAHASRSLPLVWFGVFDSPRALAPRAPLDSPSAAWRDQSGENDFARAVREIRDAIGRGDVYQVNHTVRLDVDVRGDIAALYRRLLAAQGPGYGARIHTGRHEILSASPELFLERRGDAIETKPMKGTAIRGRWLAEDDERAATLAASEKERAENVMIVDLVRNDLGRIARPGSVHVPVLFDVERRPTILQMTSSVAARLRENTSIWDLFAALFPCGSVTGAPKVAATHMIAKLETAPRGVYCGAIGHVAPGGDCTFSVAIRTLALDHDTGRAEYGVGSGITWDSAERAEYAEVVAKAGILTADLPSFELLETLRYADGSYARLERHLTRLEASATYFGFAEPAELAANARRVLERRAALRTGGRDRVRLTISAEGVATTASLPLPEPHATPPAVVLASTPIKRNNRFLFHKTTHRAVYDRQRAEHPDAFDVLLWNEDGELTEFTIGNLVAEIDGVRYTPPRESGLLAGTFREQLLQEGAIQERMLRREDLARASRMWLVNSVREWTEVVVDNREGRLEIGDWRGEI